MLCKCSTLRRICDRIIRLVRSLCYIRHQDVPSWLQTLCIASIKIRYSIFIGQPISILAHHNIFLSEYFVRAVGVSSNTSFSTYNLVYRKRWDLSLFNFGAFGDYERDHSKLIHNKIELIKHSYYRTQICRLFTRIMGGLSEVDELL